LTSDLNTYYSTSAYIANNYLALTGGVITGSLTVNGAVGLYNNTGIFNSKTFTINGGSTLSVNSTAIMNYVSGSSVTGSMNVTGISYFPAPNQSSSFSIGGGLRNNATAGTNNMAIGNCLVNNTTSNTNMAIGNDVLNSNVSSVGQHLGIGYRALESLTSGEVNIAIGFISGYKLITGSWNTFFSVASGGGFSSGSHNFCMGFQTMSSYTTPESTSSTNVNRNLALGSQAITIVSSGISDNVGIGFNALGNPYNTGNSSSLKGSYNVAIGSYAGYGLDGASCNNNVFIGYNTGVADGPSASYNTSNTYTNIIAINTGVLSSPVSNSVYIGNSSITNNTFYGTLSVPSISFTGSINSISAAVLGYISGLTSSAQTQLDSKVSLSSNNTYSGTQTYNGNISFTGTLNSMTSTIFSSINTAFGKQNSANTLISTSSTLTAPFASVYTLTNGSNIIITLPDATASNAGVNLLFRRTVAVTTTITFTTSGGTQNIYNSTNTGAVSPVLLPSSTYILRLSSMTINGTTYAWFQV
jgi:hypothetical protein